MSTTLFTKVIPDAVDWVKTRLKAVQGEITVLLTQIVTTLYSFQATITGDGAITILEGYVLLTKGSAGAITLADSTATTDDGKRITVIAGSAQAHVITAATDGFNAKGSSGTATFGGAIGDSVTFMAHGGHWYTVASINVTIA